MTAPDLMFVRENPNGAVGRWHDATSLSDVAAITVDGRNPMRPYVRRDPAVLAALPEVQTLVADALERAASLTPYDDDGFTSVHKDPHVFVRIADIRALIHADHAAALAARDERMRAEGRKDGMERAAVRVESLCFAFEGNDMCREVNSNLRKAAAAIRAEMGGEA